MSTIGLGSCTFQDMFDPVKGKSEWGMDTLTRKLSGQRSLLVTFISTLSQGQPYGGYFLQTWEPDEGPNVATITLNYKGLLPGGTPIPDVQTEVATATGSVSKDYTALNAGKGLAYRKQQLLGQQDPPVFIDVYTTGATMEFTYRAAQTTYRYVKNGAPSSPSYSAIAIGFTPVPQKIRITTADGAIYGADRQLFFSLVVVERDSLLGFKSRHVIGTPYYECEDTIRRELRDPSDPS